MKDNPDLIDHRQKLGRIYSNLASLQTSKNDIDTALDWYQKSINIWEKIATKNPDVVGYSHNWAGQLYFMSYLHWKKGNLDEALDSCKEAVRLYAELKSLRPESSNALFVLSDSLVLLARIQKDHDKKDEAIASLESVNSMVARIPEKQREQGHWSCLGEALFYGERWDEAQRALEAQIRIAGDKGPTLKGNARWWYLAMTLHQLGETDKARSYYDRLVTQLEELKEISYRRFIDSKELRDEAAKVLGIEVEKK